MEDGESKTKSKIRINRKSIRKVPVVSNVFQPIWVRYNPISTFCFNREYLVRQSNFVLFIGTLFWIIFLFSKTF